MYVTTITQSLIITMICSTVIGFAFRSMMPYLLHIFSQQTAEIAKLGTTIVLIAYNIGATISPYEKELFSQLLPIHDVGSLVLTNAVLSLLLSISGVVLVSIKRHRV